MIITMSIIHSAKRRTHLIFLSGLRKTAVLSVLLLFSWNPKPVKTQNVATTRDKFGPTSSMVWNGMKLYFIA